MGLIGGVAVSYLLGSLPTGYLVGKFVRRIDIRQHGSGSVGATNVCRVVGKRWGIGVLVIDILKGFLAVSLAPSFLNALIFGIAAIIGHTWTVWLRFRGGKGVATSLGVFLGITPGATLAAIGVWMLVFAWKRYVSLASLSTAMSFPLWVFCFNRNQDFFTALFPMSFVLTVFIFYTHRENIQRLRTGTEKKII